MILPSTIRKMQAKNQRVCRVVWPAYEVTLNGTTVQIGERREYFATESGANNSIVVSQELIVSGAMPAPRVDFIDAAKLDILFGREVE